MMYLVLGELTVLLTQLWYTSDSITDVITLAAWLIRLTAGVKGDDTPSP